MPRRPRLDKISEAMKAWSAVLGSELSTWPDVSSRSMFGFTAFYRRGVIFAVLPRTRGMNSPSSLAFKLHEASSAVKTKLTADPRINETEMQKARWFVFEMQSDDDMRAALDWLGRAYEKAGAR